MPEEKMFEKENIVRHEMIRAIGDYLERYIDAGSDLMLEFYSIRYKRGVDTFVLGYYPPEEIWCSQETDVKAFLFEWDKDQDKLVDSTEKEKEIFSEEYDLYHFDWLPLETCSDSVKVYFPADVLSELRLPLDCRFLGYEFGLKFLIEQQPEFLLGSKTLQRFERWVSLYQCLGFDLPPSITPLMESVKALQLDAPEEMPDV